MLERINQLMADFNRMSTELQARNELTRRRIARTNELLVRWNKEQSESDMGVKA